MKNNKGQVLVMFILLLPVVLLLLGLVVDTGLLFIEKRNIDGSIKEAIAYRFESNLSENELDSVVNNLLVTNINNINSSEVNISNDYIKITVNKQFDSAFALLFNRSFYEISATYVGYISAGKLVIEKE